MVYVISSSRPQARKAHHCDSCNRKIAPGETYHTAFCKDGGDVWRWRAHLACLEAGLILFRAGIEGDDGALLDVCDMDADDRRAVYTTNPEIYRAVWPDRPEPTELTVVAP